MPTPGRKNTIPSMTPGCVWQRNMIISASAPRREKEQSYGNGKADAVTKMLPIYDNLERALNQPTEDAAYKKGVELTMTELLKILNGLGVEVFGEVGDTFDPNLHNAVMHLDSEEHDENVITQVFQKGFKMGDKIVRFAMVQVAN